VAKASAGSADLPDKAALDRIHSKLSAALDESPTVERRFTRRVMLRTFGLSAPASSLRGAHVVFKLSSSVAGPRLIRCHVFDGDGVMLPVYARNLLLNDASTTFVLPSALNDIAGTYTIRATDVVSGATAETRISLK